MKNSFFKSMSSIILEAEEDDPIEVEDYSMDETQLDDANTEEETNTEDNNQTTEENPDENVEEDPNDLESEDYSMDEGQLDDETGDMEDNPEEGLEDTSTDEETISENHKKYVLLKTYKQLLLDISNVNKSFSNLMTSIDDDLFDHSVYVEGKMKGIKEKINFIIQKEFLTKPYSYLLTSYMYLEKERDVILDLIEKLIKYNND